MMMLAEVSVMPGEGAVLIAHTSLVLLFWCLAG